MLFISLLTSQLISFVTSQAAEPLPFAWGFGTSAFQIEGAWDIDGKAPQVWDTITNTNTNLIADAKVTADHYHHMKGNKKNVLLPHEIFQHILEQGSLSFTIDHIPIKMFLVWSLLDNFEWGNYNEKFGIVLIMAS